MKGNTKICIVGNMLGRNPGWVTTQGQVLADKLPGEGFDVISVSSKTNRFTRLAEIIYTLVARRRSIDVVVLEVYSGLYFVIAEAASLLCRVFRLPLIMVLHGGELPGFYRRHPRRTAWVLNRADRLVAPSSFLAHEFEKAGFPVRVIPNIIDLQDSTFRERGSIAPNLLWMRSFHPIYDPEMAIKVFAEVKKRHAAAVLTMAGKDKGLEEMVRKLAAELGVANAVRFPGFLNAAKKSAEFDSADIFLNTNRIDNMPVSVVEACSFGVPVVATRVGGIPYLLRDRMDALLVDSGDVKQMADAICELLDSPGLVRELSRNGRLLAKRSDWHNVKHDWIRVFGECSVIRGSSTAPRAEDTVATN